MGQILWSIIGLICSVGLIYHLFADFGIYLVLLGIGLIIFLNRVPRDKKEE